MYITKKPKWKKINMLIGENSYENKEFNKHKKINR